MSIQYQLENFESLKLKPQSFDLIIYIQFIIVCSKSDDSLPFLFVVLRKNHPKKFLYEIFAKNRTNFNKKHQNRYRM